MQHLETCLIIIIIIINNNNNNLLQRCFSTEPTAIYNSE